MAKIFVSAGHGGKQPGAVRGNLIEKNFTLDIANRLAKLLRDAGHTVVQNRTTDVDCLPKKTVQLANASGAEFFVEIHLNSFTLSTAKGCEVYYYKGDSKGQKLATDVCKAIAGIGYANRGAKANTGYYVIKNTKMTAILVECCFLSSPEDMARFNADKMAKAIYDGISKTYPAIAKPAEPKPAEQPKPAKQSKLYRVQVGAFANKANADKLANELKSKGYSVIVVES